MYIFTILLLFSFFCYTSMLFSSAYTCDLFYCLHFEYMYTVEQCFVRYLCYRTPDFFIPFSRFASVCYVICYHNETCLFKDLRFYFLQTSDNLCTLVPFCVALWRKNGKKICIYLAFFFIHFHLLTFPFCNYMDQLCNNSLNNEDKRLQNIPPISQRFEVYMR